MLNTTAIRTIDQEKDTLIALAAQMWRHPETAYNEVGFEEQAAIDKLTKIFQKVQGGSLTLFHEKDGQLTDMKKIY